MNDLHIPGKSALTFVASLGLFVAMMVDAIYLQARFLLPLLWAYLLLLVALWARLVPWQVATGWVQRNLAIHREPDPSYWRPGSGTSDGTPRSGAAMPARPATRQAPPVPAAWVHTGPSHSTTGSVLRRPQEEGSRRPASRPSTRPSIKARVAAMLEAGRRRIDAARSGSRPEDQDPRP